jgi:hypothetical protein
MRFTGFAVGAAAIAVAVMVSASAPGKAASMPNLSHMKDDAVAQSQVEKTHGWHRTCRRGLNGWHKHVKGVGRVQCTTAKCWTNSLGYKQCRYF